MVTEICVVTLPGNNNYAVVSPGRITFGLNASPKELDGLIEEEKYLAECEEEITQEENVPYAASIALMPTMDCNMRCIYCYSMGGDTQEYMSLDQAISAIEHTSDNKDRHIDVYLVGGGEPFLNFSVIKDAIAYAESIYNSVTVHVVTNGTFGEDVLGWMRGREIFTRISYDGVLHDSQRPLLGRSTSSELVRSNIKRLIEQDTSVVVQSTVTRDSLGYIKDSILDIAELGAGAIKIEPASSNVISRSDESITPSPLEYAKAILEAITFIADHDLSIKLDSAYFSEPQSGFYCGMQNFNQTVTPKGSVTACVEVARDNDPYADLVIIGQLDQAGFSIDSRKRNKLSQLHFNNYIGGCRDCSLRLICQGGCPMSNIWRSGLPMKKSTYTCSVEQYLIPRLLLKIATNPKVADVVLDQAEFLSC